MENKTSPTKKRMKLMKAGDVFTGLNKIKNKGQRRLLESERHNNFMDMLPVDKVSPNIWAEGLMTNLGINRAISVIEGILKGSKAADPMMTPYLESRTAIKNKNFYINALGYLRNKHVRD